MAKNLSGIPGDAAHKQNGSSIESNKKEVNSWDRSSSHSRDSMPENKRMSDWDATSRSDCHETIVEPFVDKAEEYVGDDDGDWDSDDKSAIDRTEGAPPQFKPVSGSGSSFNSLDLSLGVSEVNKNSLFDLFKMRSEHSKRANDNRDPDSGEGARSYPEDDSLLVEDIEEFAKDDASPTQRGRVRESNNSQGTLDDTTVWMIPKSDRTCSNGSEINDLDAEFKLAIPRSNRTCSNGSERDNLDAELKLAIPRSRRTCSNGSERANPDAEINRIYLNLKRAKSSPSVEKRHRRKHAVKSSRSDCVYNVKWKPGDHLNNISMTWEGSGFREKNDPPHKSEEKNENFYEPQVYFAEYECRTATMNPDVPEKMNGAAVDVGPTEAENETDAEILNGGSDRENGRNDSSRNDLVLAGPSTQTSLEVVSLPDIIGRNAIKNRQTKDKYLRRLNNGGETGQQTNGQINEETRNETWFLLDETGQYQAVTKNEVAILLNGQSAEAVLQGRKEHLIRDVRNQRVSLEELITKESIQNFLRQEDMGGEGHDKKSIDLERKVENTLLYIQPGINLTASIRIIPVETEMIHLWRRSRDTGSLLSSEVDLRLETSQDSVENPTLRTMNEHHVTYLRRITMERTQQTVAEQDEFMETPTGNPSTVNNNLDTRMVDFSKLLIETRMIVDNLTNSFKLLQNRLDGETNKSSALQEEVVKLRQLLNEPEEKAAVNEREYIGSHPEFKTSSCSSASSGQTPETPKVKSDENKTERISLETHQNLLNIAYQKDSKISQGSLNNKNRESSDYITVNIYTTDESVHFKSSQRRNTMENCDVAVVQETNSLLQANLGIIEGKMKRLEEENDAITTQNAELKKKLREISLELEKYLSSAAETDACSDDDKDMDALRNQVCNLKLELDNLKKKAGKQQRELEIDNALMRETLEMNSISLQEWLTTSDQLFQEIENLKSKFGSIGIFLEDCQDPEGRNPREPKHFFYTLKSFIRRITERLLASQCRNSELSHCQNGENSKETLDSVISDYNNLIDQCKKGAVSSGDQILDDYFAVIMEKASLMEEIKIFKTENEILLQDQMDHHEKLKQTMIALKDRKREIIALESAQKLFEEEKTRISEMLKSSDEQKAHLLNEMSEKDAKIKGYLEENKFRLLELENIKERLESANDEIKNLEKTCKLKDDVIQGFKTDNERLSRLDEAKQNQIIMLKSELEDLQHQKTQAESDMASVKIVHKEMAEYINHLETIANGNQESFEKNKQKLKDANQTIVRLKAENEALERRYQCDLKLYGKTKEDLDSCNEKLANLTDKYRRVEEEKNKLEEKLRNRKEEEKRAEEALNSALRDYHILESENESLKEKIDIYSKDRDESLKEQKDLINKYAILSKELQKLQEKYRHVKSECNERTNVIRYLEKMLKDNASDYNDKIAYLENNITHILEKIAACRYSMKDKHGGVDVEIRQLRQQLNLTCKERQELENVLGDYYEAVKRLEGEIQERDKEMNELHNRMSKEQEKRSEKSNIFTDGKRECCERYESIKVEQLENEILGIENELADCKKKLKQNEINHENEKNKLELTIADLKSEINRYKLRTEVMMKNLSETSKNFNTHNLNKRNAEEMTKKLQALREDVEMKDRLIGELTESVNRHKADAKLRETELEDLNKKIYCMGEMVKNLQNSLLETETALSATSKTNERQQREKNEIAEKLLQSIKIIMEEKSARQTIQMVTVEKEKSFQEQLDRLKNELLTKSKNCSTLSDEIEDKKRFIFKLQHDLKKMKLENASLKTQMHKANENDPAWRNWNEEALQKSNSLTQIKFKNYSPERMETCLRELKEIRDINLLLRKTEGEHQAKIVRLEDEIRDARILIKELEGGLKIEKKSRKALKNMILSAKMEINRCLAEKQIVSMVADRISRHLDLEDFQCRGFRGLKGSNSSESYY